MNRFACSFCICLIGLPSVLGENDVRFNRDVRPILSTSCNKCHGPDDAERAADLRLDQAAGIQHAFSGGLENSEGWNRINAADPDVVMPPKEAHVDLSDDDKATLQTWIQAGAVYEGHWSLIAAKKTEPPQVASQSPWIRGPIDAFVLARLKEANLQPNSEAKKTRLLRRITFDLLGLPPTTEEIDDFLNDESADAYENVVDRLLASPHFGERMATNWMDAARYGDTSVFHADGPRDMWPWRDWVIQAYNNNMPFDQFTIEQLAGDLLPNANTSQKVATGFLRNNATTDEGGLIEEEYRVEYAIDRVKTTSMVWMGLSMECAQCHSHKYDPISQEEYYRFFAYFNQAADPGRQTRNGNQAPVTDIFNEENLAKADEIKQQLTGLMGRLKKVKGDSEPAFQTWLNDRSESPPEKSAPTGQVLHVPLDETTGSKVVSLSTDTGQVQGPPKWAEGKFGGAFECDGSNFVEFDDAGDFDGSHGFSYGAWIKPKGRGNGAAIARMVDGNRFRGYDLYLSNGQVAVHLIHSWTDNAIKVTTNQKLKADTWQHVFATYDGSGKANGVKIFVDGELWKWKVNEDRLTKTIQSQGPFRIGRRNDGSRFQGLVDDVQVFDRTLSAQEVQQLMGQDPISPLLALKPEERTEQQTETLRQHYLRSEVALFQTLQKQIDKLSAEEALLRKPEVNVMVMGDVKKMRPTYVLERGSYDAPLKDRELQPGVPQALPPLPAGAAANRLGLAQWLVQDSHPLTARVAVNNLWAMLFGQGIVKSQEDFGAQGAWPSHPELLDWLAVDFVESGWDVKRMVKQLVMTSAYRQSARNSSEKQELDPENRLLSRGPRFRLQAEFVRDTALAVSDLLNNTIGGPGVKPYQPPGLWNEVSLNGNVRFVQDKGDKLYRRSMYTYWKRSAPAPSMTIFDAPTREKCALRRSRTNTPLQALVTLNDPQFVEAARVLAEVVLQKHSNDPEAAIADAYRRATSTQPDQRVTEILQEAFHEERRRFEANPEAATQILSIGESERDPKLPTAIHAALTTVCSMILNLDETLTR